MQHTSLLYPATTVPVQEDGWMSPDGTYYPCGFYHHSEAAEEIAGMDVWELEESGWVHISGDCIRNEDVRLTQAQRDMLFDMFMLNPNSWLAHNLAPFLHIEM